MINNSHMQRVNNIIFCAYLKCVYNIVRYHVMCKVNFGKIVAVMQQLFYFTIKK